MSLKVITMSEWFALGKEPDILFWVGSAGSFDERAKKITRAFVKILNKANVSFGVLGTEESSSGDAAKRAGNEFLFQMQALMNIEVMNNYNVKKIVTTCPHSFNTLKNEYKGLGGKYKVLHHSQFIEEIIENGSFINKKSKKKYRINFHDPCYLGREINIYETEIDRETSDRDERLQTDFAQIKFKESGAITIDSDNNQSSRNFQFKDGDGSSLMFIGDDGKIGIRTTAPDHILYIEDSEPTF